MATEHGEPSRPDPIIIAAEPPPTNNDSAADSAEIDSAFDSAASSSSDLSSYTTSLLSAVTDYKYENGRRYHAYREGEYVLPNDDEEQDRQDLLHHMRGLLLDGALFRAPIGRPARALDVGTGTGIWALDFADQFPDCEVVGTDLSPIQPAWVPPNLHFQVEDCEAEWVWGKPFDYIHVRDLGGAVRDWDRLLRQGYEHLTPGGWIELQEFDTALMSDDGSLELHAPNADRLLKLVREAAERFGKKMDNAKRHARRLRDAGFEDVETETFKVPVGQWPKDAKLKEIGKFNFVATITGIDSYSLALLTRVLGWDIESTHVFLASVRKELRSPKVHAYGEWHVVYGRKPE